MVKIENLAQASNELDEWLAGAEDLAEEALRGLAMQAFSLVVYGTPEWSGNLASNWRLSIGSPAENYSESPYKAAPLGKGPLPEPYSRVAPNYAAISYALSLAKEEAPLIRLGADVFITNTAPYAQEVEDNERARDGKAFIRAINLPIEMTHAAADKLNAMGELSEVAINSMQWGPNGF